MSETAPTPLSSLDRPMMDDMRNNMNSTKNPYVRDCATEKYCRDFYHKKTCDGEGYGNVWGWGFLGFIFLVVIIWVILFFVKPDFILRKDEFNSDCHNSDSRDCDVDGGRALLWAIVIAIIILILIAIFAAAFGGWGRMSNKY